MQKNVAGQRWIVFAFNVGDNTAKTGDALNITANLRIDGAAANAVDDVNPTELEDGYYAFDITQLESNGNNILICPQSSTTDVQVIGVPGAVYTTAPNFNVLGIEADGDLTKVNTLNGHTAQTADHTAGIADIPTVAEFNARTLLAADYVVVSDTLAGVTLVNTVTNVTNQHADDLSSAIWTSARAGYLDELAAANLPADIAAILLDTGTVLPAAISANKSGFEKNVAVPGFSWTMVDFTDLKTLRDDLQTALRSAGGSQINIDGAGFVDLTNIATVNFTETGIYEADLTQAELNGTSIVLRFTAAGALTRIIYIKTSV